MKKENKLYLCIGLIMLMFSYSESLLESFCKNKYTNYIEKITTKYNEKQEIIAVWKETEEVRNIKSPFLCQIVENNNIINIISNIVIRITGYLIIMLTLFSKQIIILKNNLLDCIKVIVKLKK